VKTFLDIVLAAVLLILLLPILILVAILIVIFDFQSPLFRQERIGLGKLPFTIYKLQTMKNGEVTFFGKVLRASGIDELPQLLNILFLEMSFVGPRPLTQSDVVRLGWDGEHHKLRWDVKPGIVGLAQLSPICNKKMSWFYDKLYVKHNNLWLDTKIFCAAIFIPIVGKKKIQNWIHKT
jgi:lipopolysaccharide/colanic/teichoic acid biosynthesis glycosyltransferase